MGGDLRVGEERRGSSESRGHHQESAPPLAKFIPAALKPTESGCLSGYFSCAEPPPPPQFWLIPSPLSPLRPLAAGGRQGERESFGDLSLEILGGWWPRLPQAPTVTAREVVSAAGFELGLLRPTLVRNADRSCRELLLHLPQDSLSPPRKLQSRCKNQGLQVCTAAFGPSPPPPPALGGLSN